VSSTPVTSTPVQTAPAAPPPPSPIASTKGTTRSGGSPAVP
jgi:hypothetical protein